MNADISKPYRSGLSTPELLDELARLLAEQRRGERLVCRYLAELADRFAAEGGLGGYSDVYHLARVRLGLGVRAARERVRVGRALAGLPAIERALIEGELSFSKVREVTRVAAGGDELRWLALAKRVSTRTLEQHVARASGDANDRGARSREPAEVHWTTPRTVDVRMKLSAAVWALVARAMEGARRASEGPLSDAEALEAIAREALARQGEAGDAADPSRIVVLYECRFCRRTEVETGSGAVELEDGAAAVLGCGAGAVDLRTEGRGAKRGGAIPASIRRAVKLRDRCRCRVPGCFRRRYVDVHHLEPRADGGEHSRENCLCLCSTCHEKVHEGLLRIEGHAEGRLVFFDADGAPLFEDGAGAQARGDMNVPVTRGESPGAGETGSVTHVESPGAGDAGFVTHVESPLDIGTPACMLRDVAPPQASPAAARLLRVMGTRGGWHPELLHEESGLSYQEVACALLELELAGRARNIHGQYQVVA